VELQLEKQVISSWFLRSCVVLSGLLSFTLFVKSRSGGCVFREKSKAYQQPNERIVGS
jgi:hypothetical protein